MHQKYASVPSSRIYSNDLYFAAYLHSHGYEVEIIRNDRRRVTFAFSCSSEALALREAYRSGRMVMVDLCSFADSLKHIRRLMSGEEQRSMSHGRASCPVDASRQPALQPLAHA